MNTLLPSESRPAVLGLGYVGLPLAIALGRIRPTIGFDIDAARIEQLRRHVDHSGECSPEEIAAAEHLRLSADLDELRAANVYIIAVPTPVNQHKWPDLTPLLRASETVGRVLKRGDVVVYESTVYPGATEQECVPVLERVSGLECNRDFSVGYSPERINPGDKARRLPDIVKVTSGSTPEAAAFIDALYRQIVPAGTHLAPSIQVAEAAKAIENTQRDVNIALVNELAMIFDAMGIDTHDVLAAAGTKWTFLPFKPGLVGGHCIGVDPYYLTHKATVLGYHPELILAARRINSRMGLHVAHQVMRLMAQKRIHVVGSRVLVLGLTFKEDCADLRNTRVVDIVRELQASNAQVDIHDPWADAEEARRELGLDLVAKPEAGAYDAVVLAVAHKRFLELPGGVAAFARDPGVVFDVKGVLPAGVADARL